jgi:hypothetical protein
MDWDGIIKKDKKIAKRENILSMVI